MAVIPAKAGIQCPKSLVIVRILSHCDFWTPAFAGVTGVGFQVRNSYQDLPGFEIFRMFINPENPLILVILILTVAAGMDFAQARR